MEICSVLIYCEIYLLASTDWCNQKRRNNYSIIASKIPKSKGCTVNTARIAF